MSERTRNALITVLWSWVGFAVTAAWFGHDLGIYPSRSAARQIALAHPVVPDAVQCARRGRRGRPGRHRDRRGGVRLRSRPLCAQAPAERHVRADGRAARGRGRLDIAACTSSRGPGASGSASTGRLTLELLWFLLGLAGIAGSTQAIAAIIARTEFSPTTWRIGAAAAAAVSAAMLVGTGATIVWGLAIRSAQAHPGGAAGWLVVTAILAVTTARAVIALIGSRRHTATAEPAVA